LTMNFSIFVLILVLGTVNCYTESEYKEAFAEWIQTRQVYSNSEFQTRYAIFKDNMTLLTSLTRSTNQYTLEHTLMVLSG